MPSRKQNNQPSNNSRPEPEFFEHVQLIFRNFAGRPNSYKPQGGVRDFCIVIDDEQRAHELMDKGWYIKERIDAETGEPVFWYLRVTASYRFTPPEVYMLVPGKDEMTFLDEKLIGNLDHADIEWADVLVTASRWEFNGKTGIKAYLQELYAMPRPNRFTSKYGGYRVSNAQQPDNSVPEPSVAEGSVYDDEIPF